ncbi:hypothetical protein [Winogradskya humida]|uniref:hypothetical protein n=1 Tax=Winogradskya humida TaxID=113566 RepID=UPI001942CF1E|nr:hypothetical protein [Actinoplanes humidus]
MIIGAAIALPTAAHAAPQDLTLTIKDGITTEGGKQFPIRLRVPDMQEGFFIEDVQVAIDTTDITSVTALATIAPGATPECTTAGTVTTCDLGSIGSADDDAQPTMLVTAKPGTAPGSTGKLKVTLTAKGIEPLVAAPAVTVAEQVDLAISDAPATVEAKPGELVPLGVRITNRGTNAIPGVALRIGGGGPLTRRGSFDNCYHLNNDVETFCRFETTLEPGKTYVVDGTVLGVRKDAKPGQDSYAAAVWTLDDIDDLGIMSDYPHDSGAPLKLVELPAVAAAARVPASDPDFSDNLAEGKVTILAGLSPSPSPSLSAPTATPTTTPPVAGGDTGGEGGGGTLPITGSPVGLIASIGAGALLIGILGLVATRRRARFTA